MKQFVRQVHKDKKEQSNKRKMSKVTAVDIKRKMIMLKRKINSRKKVMR